MDERTTETLSRFVDGDLPADEAARIEAALAGDEALASEVARMRKLRSAVRRLAEGMDPPRALDVALEPLRRGAPSRGAPWWQWAGAAAAVLAAALVGVELVGRPAPGPSAPVRTVRATPAPGAEPFRLRPLPRFVRDPEDGLAEVPPPDAPAPRPLEVVGPLDGEGARAEERAPGGEATLRVDGVGRTISIGGAGVSLPPGRYSVQVEVVDGRITSAEIADESVPPVVVPELVGVRLDEPADGIFLGELEVGPR